MRFRAIFMAMWGNWSDEEITLKFESEVRNMGEMMYIVTHGIYEDEMIEFVCSSLAVAKGYVDERWEEGEFYWAYELKLHTPYDGEAGADLPTEHIVYRKKGW